MVALETKGELTQRAFDEPGAPAAKVRLWGFIGAPGVSRSSREHQHVFVNRRPVENRGLNFALKEGYHTALMKGRFPVCCLFLEIDPGEVDVNIHPAKREVKFHREREVRRFVAEAAQGALQNYHEGSREVAHAPTLEIGSERIESAADIALQLDTTPPGQTNGTSHLPEAQPAVEQGNLAMGFALRHAMPSPCSCHALAVLSAAPTQAE